MEGIYSGAWFIGKRERFRECKRDGSRIWRKTECRIWQKKLDMAEERDFRRGVLLEKYTVKILYGWDNGKFEKNT